MVFCNDNIYVCLQIHNGVTILILIDGFLQYSIDLKVLKNVLKSQSLF